MDDELLKHIVGTKLAGYQYGESLYDFEYDIACQFVNEFKKELDDVYIIIETNKITSNMDFKDQIEVGIELYKLLINRSIYNLENYENTSDILVESAIVNVKYKELFKCKKR